MSVATIAITAVGFILIAANGPLSRLLTSMQPSLVKRATGGDEGTRWISRILLVVIGSGWLVAGLTAAADGR